MKIFKFHIFQSFSTLNPIILIFGSRKIAENVYWGLKFNQFYLLRNNNFDAGSFCMTGSYLKRKAQSLGGGFFLLNIWKQSITTNVEVLISFNKQHYVKRWNRHANNFKSWRFHNDVLFAKNGTNFSWLWGLSVGKLWCDIE